MSESGGEDRLQRVAPACQFSDCERPATVKWRGILVCATCYREDCEQVPRLDAAASGCRIQGAR